MEWKKLAIVSFRNNNNNGNLERFEMITVSVPSHFQKVLTRVTRCGNFELFWAFVLEIT
jgi:hypothetical protein